MGVLYTGTYITCATEADVLALAGKAGDIAYAVDTDMRYKSNGSAWFPTDALRVIRGTAAVNAMSAGTTKILTVPPTSFRFVALAAHVEVVSLTGTVILQPSLSVGTNATNYNNLFTSSPISGLLTSIGLVSSNALTIASAIPPLAGSTDVYAKNTAATGPTAYTIGLDIMGYFKV